MSMQNLAVVVSVSPFYDVNPSSVRIMTSVALIRAMTSLPASRPSSSALSRVMRLTRWSSPTCSPTLAAASPLTTSVILPGSLLRVLIFTSFFSLSSSIMAINSMASSRSFPDLLRLAGEVAGGQDHDEGEAQDKHRQCYRRVEVPLKFGEDGEGYRLGHALDVSREDDRATELSKRSRPGGDGPSHQSWKRQRDCNLQKDRNRTTPVHQRGLLYTPLYLTETDRRLPNVEVRCDE